MRIDLARRQKKGLHFIVTSIILWAAIFVSQVLDLSLWQQNMFIFVCSAALFPLALLASRILHIDFQSKDNPLTKLGILFSVNQMLYILIAMWAFAKAPEQMLMIYAMIFGAHLMPFSWLYRSRSYLIFSILIPIASMAIGLLLPSCALALFMVVAEIVFSCCLAAECKKL
ncbi:MAG: hypothetical protein K6E35_08555 [Bacteroidales bacterium]|nr:hypothetical protein [Bacteroidales bacterium]